MNISIISVPVREGQRSTYPVGVIIETPTDFTLSQKPNSVVELDPFCPSATNGLRLGDTIVSVNNSSVLQFSAEELMALLDSGSEKGPITARVARYGLLEFWFLSLLHLFMLMLFSIH